MSRRFILGAGSSIWTPSESGPYDEGLSGPGLLTPVVNTSVPTGRPPKSYEFPTGYNQAFGDIRYHTTEALFNPAVFLSKVSLAFSERLLA
jgi:hypothetical protein